MHEWLHAQLPPRIQWCVLQPRANVLTFFNYTNYSAIKLYFQAQNNHLHPSLYNLLPRNNKTGIQCIWKALNSVQASVFHLTQNITRKTCLWYSRCAHQLFLLQQQSRRVKWLSSKKVPTPHFYVCAFLQNNGMSLPCAMQKGSLIVIRRQRVFTWLCSWSQHNWGFVCF